MRSTIVGILLAAAIASPAPAQVAPGAAPLPALSEADRAAFRAFGNAFDGVRRNFLGTVSDQDLLVRAARGLAGAEAKPSPTWQRAVAATADRVAADKPDNVLPMLRDFGNGVDALRRLPEAPSVEAMLRPAVAGMLDGLDARTRFLPPAPGASEQGTAGLELAVGGDGPRVVRPLPASPAATAGIRPGDVLLSVDGHATSGLPLDQVVALLRGPVGSSCTLVVRRGADPSPVTVTVARAVVRIAPIAARLIGAVAYLRIRTFAPGTAQGVRQGFTALKDRAAAPLRGLVLDLRDNTGGRLDEVVATADELLPSATLIATLAGRNRVDDKRFVAAAGDLAAGLPVIVLVNETTGAGSEILAAALQSGRNAVLMGGHTAGAGMVATVIPLPPLGAMQLTTQRLILPSGQALVPPGLLPQVALMPAGDAAPAEEAASSDPLVLRLRRGIPQRPRAGEPFDAPDAPEQDFEVRQACAAIGLLAPAP